MKKVLTLFAFSVVMLPAWLPAKPAVVPLQTSINQLLLCDHTLFFRHIELSGRSNPVPPDPDHSQRAAVEVVDEEPPQQYQLKHDYNCMLFPGNYNGHYPDCVPSGFPFLIYDVTSPPPEV
ncbi:MAG TPA: hypothetical protein PKE63_03415 [Lacibacter sp.]|nr:hypothetical protein [Lacibacter sp.]HMO88413.1 hypothetical protein [Lacibacter sp.]HMP86297.1 hypothetical protein [Lacibacter sp.]